jgi:excisionase family DNA binding protein
LPPTFPSSLLRLSQLARFWEVNPVTILGWIRQGRLASVRSPGGHHRVRAADVRAFCERQGLPVPPFVSPPPRRVVSAAAIPRGARPGGLAFAIHDDPYEALLAAASGPTALLVLPASAGRFDAIAAIAAMRTVDTTAAIPVVVVDVPGPARAEALVRAGATRTLGRRQRDDLGRVLRELLSLE